MTNEEIVNLVTSTEETIKDFNEVLLKILDASEGFELQLVDVEQALKSLQEINKDPVVDLAQFHENKKEIKFYERRRSGLDQLNKNSDVLYEVCRLIILHLKQASYEYRKMLKELEGNQMNYEQQH